MPLSGKATRHLRALGHHLRPLVQIGKEGLTDGVVAATSRALLDHELVKIRLGTEAPEERGESALALAERSSSELVQTLGRVFLLYKRHPNKPRIDLPRAETPREKAARAAKAAKAAKKAAHEAGQVERAKAAEGPADAAPPAGDAALDDDIDGDDRDEV